MLRRLGEGIEASKGLMAAAKRGVGEFDTAASSSLARVLGTAPEPTRVEPFQRLPKAPVETELAEEELRNVIAPGYFEKDFDPVRHMLESLPADSEEPGSSARFTKHIGDEYARYESALDRVTHELSANVMANYGTFVNGMSQISELGSDLIVTGMRCKAARRHLRAADDSLSRNGLTLIGKLRRRAAMRMIAARLEGITDAVQAANRLQALLAAELSEKAASAPELRLLLEAAHLFATCAAAKASAGEGSLLHRLTVIAELEAVHARLLALLDDARRRLCAAFEPGVYGEVLQCAVCLGGVDELATSTADTFASAINHQLSETARRCVFEQFGITPEGPVDARAAPAVQGARSAPQQPGATMPATSADAAAIASSLKLSATASQRQRVNAASLKELVGMLHEDRVSVAFASMLRALAESLSAHHAMVLHHQGALGTPSEHQGALGTPSEHQGALGTPSEHAEASRAGGKARAKAGGGAEPAARGGAEVPRAVHETLSKSLALGRGAVWVEVQRQLAVALVSAPTATFSTEQILRLLGQVELFMRLGHAFSGEPATVLRASVRTKSASFFAAFHRERLDEVRMRLEGELWQRLPPLTPDTLAATLFARGQPDEPAAGAGQAAAASERAADSSAAGGSALFPASYAVLEPLLQQEMAAQRLTRQRAQQQADEAAAAAAAGANGAANGHAKPSMQQPAQLPASTAKGGAAMRAGLAAAGLAGAQGGAAGAQRGVAGPQGLWERWTQLNASADSAEAAGAQPAHAGAAASNGADGQAAAAVPSVPAPLTGDDGRPLAISGSALHLAKMMHRYVHLMHVLPPIAGDAFGGLASLFELLLLVMFTQFWGGPRVGSAGWDEGPLAEHLAARLKGTLLRLHHILIEGQSESSEKGLSAAALETAAAMRKTAQRLVSVLHAPSHAGALSARLGPQESICAVDSLRFLVAVLESARPRIEALLRGAYAASAPAQLAQVASFFAQVVDAVPHLQDLILRSLVRRTLDLAGACAAVGSHKWDLREIGTTESGYVHQFVAAAQTAVTHISLLPVSPLTVARLHGMISEAVGAALVEGYAAARKCSQEGRAQMSIDVTTLQAELSDVLKCSVSLGRADEYVKAYYKPADELIDWAKEHREYSARQLLALVNCTQLKKKERDDVIKALDEVRGGELSRSVPVGMTLESMMSLTSGSISTTNLSTTSAAGGAESHGEDTPVKASHVRQGSHGAAPQPRTFGSIGKWAQSEAAAKLKAANAAIGATGVRRPASSGADGPDGSAGPASSNAARTPFHSQQ